MTFSQCADDVCSAITRIELGAVDDADYEADLSVLFTPTGDPMVVVNEATGIRILRPFQK